MSPGKVKPMCGPGVRTDDKEADKTVKKKTETKKKKK
jgi:hypothetical protein